MLSKEFILKMNLEEMIVRYGSLHNLMVEEYESLKNLGLSLADDSCFREAIQENLEECLLMKDALEKKSFSGEFSIGDFSTGGHNVVEKIIKNIKKKQ